MSEHWDSFEGGVGEASAEVGGDGTGMDSERLDTFSFVFYRMQRCQEGSSSTSCVTLTNVDPLGETVQAVLSDVVCRVSRKSGLSKGARQEDNASLGFDQLGDRRMGCQEGSLDAGFDASPPVLGAILGDLWRTNG